jgi:predicted permease
MLRIAGDVRFAARMIAKTPWMSAAAVLSLAGAMAVCIGSFSVFWDSYFTALPFPASDRIVAMRDLDTKSGAMPSPRLAVFREWKARQRSFDTIAAAYSRTREITDGHGGVVRYRAATMTASGFQIAGVAPLLGRALSPADEAPGAEPVVVLGYRVWARLFGSDATIVGRTIALDRELRRVAGVMPEGFRFPMSEDLWVPFRIDAAANATGDPLWMRAFGRLRPGVRREQAETELESIRAAYSSSHPEDSELRERRARVLPYVKAENAGDGDAVVYGMFAFMVLVLAVACASVANLLLCRAMARQGELAVRAAMGASRLRLVRQLFIETLAITSMAAVAGVGAASLGLRWFNAYIPTENLPFWVRFDVNVPSAVFAVIGAFAAAAMAGIAPALRATSSNVVDVLKDHQRSASGVRFGAVSGALTVVEVTIAVACLAAAGLASRSLLDALSTRSALPGNQVLVADVQMSGDFTVGANGELSVPASAIPEARWGAVAEQVRTSIAALPGVTSVALATRLPMQQHNGEPIEVAGASPEESLPDVAVLSTRTTPELFAMFRARLLAGRLLTRADTNGTERVAVVNRALAARFFGASNPLGRQIRRRDGERPQPWLTIVGIIGDLPMNPSANTNEPGYYTPFAQDAIPSFSIAARVDAAPMTLAAAVRNALAGVDDRIEISSFQTHTDMAGDMLVMYKMMGVVFAALGGAALFLAVAGLYAVMSFSVIQRTREIGIRLALGATASQVTAVVLRRGVRQILLGIALGSAGGWVLMRLLALVPIGTAPVSASLLAMAAATMLTAGASACLTPMLRALRVRPVDALRA